MTDPDEWYNRPKPIPDNDILDADILDADEWEPTMDYTHDEWVAIHAIFDL